MADAFEKAQAEYAIDGSKHLTGQPLKDLIERLVRAGVGRPRAETVAFNYPAQAIEQLEYLSCQTWKPEDVGRRLTWAIERNADPPADYGKEMHTPTSEAELHNPAPTDFASVAAILETVREKIAAKQHLTDDEWVVYLWERTGIPTTAINRTARRMTISAGYYYTPGRVADRDGPWYAALGENAEQRMAKLLKWLTSPLSREIATNASQGIQQAKDGNAVEAIRKIKSQFRASVKGLAMDPDTRHRIEADLAELPERIASKQAERESQRA